MDDKAGLRSRNRKNRNLPILPFLRRGADGPRDMLHVDAPAYAATIEMALLTAVEAQHISQDHPQRLFSIGELDDKDEDSCQDDETPYLATSNERRKSSSGLPRVRAPTKGDCEARAIGPSHCEGIMHAATWAAALTELRLSQA